MMKIYDGRSSFYQWDIDQKVTSPNLLEGDEVHFYNMTLPKALVVKAYVLDGVVVADVPNIILQEALAIKVYHYVTDKDSRRTRAEYKFTVTARAMPEDYVYTETETLTIESYVKKFFDEIIENGDFGGGNGGTGIDGKSAYEIAVDNGFEGTEEEWLESLKGKFTEEDKAEMVQSVLEALPDYREVAH